MHSIYYDVKKRGGVAATHELLHDGHSSHQLTAAVRRGEVIRARQGHYVCPDLSEPEQQAVRVGGRLTALSGARFHRIWTPPDAGTLAVAVTPNSRELRSRHDKSVRLRELASPRVAAWWNDFLKPGTRSVLNPLACLEAIISSESPIVAFTAVESALNRGLVTGASWRRHLASVPRRKRGWLDAAGRRSESGGESLLKFHLLEDGVRFTQQVRIAGVGRVDFLVGDRLIIESDGGEFHTSRAAFEEDRRRDAILSALGYRVLRFSYHQIHDRWPEVQLAIQAALSRGDHLR